LSLGPQERSCRGPQSH